jgi:E3 ubiquitin-protein ligase BRE1
MVDSDKRLLECSDESGSKRVKLDELSTDGPLTQQDVVYFKKEAIWRQMQSYKSQVSRLSREIAQYNTSIAVANEKIATIDSWYKQVITLLQPFAKDAVENVNDNFLLDVDDEILLARRSQLLSIVSSIMSTISDKVSIDANIDELSKEIASLTKENKQLAKIKQDLLDKIDILNQKLVKFENQQLREQSSTLKRVGAGSLKQEEESPQNGSDENQSQNSQESSLKTETTTEVKSTNEQEEQAKLNTEELEKLTIEIEELRSTTQLLNTQINDISEKHRLSEQAKLDLENKLSNLPEAQITSTITYKNLQGEHNALKIHLAKLDKINDMNRQKLQQLESHQNNISSLLQQETQDELNLLNSQLSKSEADLVRIRAARDELLSKNAILKSELENQKSSEELSKLNSILSQRINHLEKEQLEKFAEHASDSRLQDQSKEQLIELITQLNVELKEIESAFKDSREVSIKKLNEAIDQQNLIKKLNIEKTKADQKYFASMRLKDSVQSENKVLKVQIGKSQDLIKNLNELEKSYLNKIDILTKSINDYKTIKENSVSEVTKLQEQNKSLTNWKQDKQQEFKKYQDNIKSKQDEIHNLKQDISQRDIQISKLNKNLKSTESLLKKYKANNTSSILAEDEQQIEALRSIAKCSVCSKNWKDTVITACGHVFCSSCTQERLAARLRRCPSCNKGFSANDLLTIHL